MMDFLNSDLGRLIVGILVCGAAGVITLAVIGAMIGFCLTAKHRNETWDRRWDR